VGSNPATPTINPLEKSRLFVPIVLSPGRREKNENATKVPECGQKSRNRSRTAFPHRSRVPRAGPRQKKRRPELTLGTAFAFPFGHQKADSRRLISPTPSRGARTTLHPDNPQAATSGIDADIAQTAPLARYDAACRAIAEVRSVDEVKGIRDQAIAMAAYARQAKNHDLEADCVEIRLRATRRLDQLRLAQKETVGLNQGAVPGKTGLRGNPVLDPRPTLANQGIDKNLAHQARVLGAMDDAAFERKVLEARDSAARVFCRAVREAEVAREREERRAPTSVGGSVADLMALIASGYRAGVIGIDIPWSFDTYNDQSPRCVGSHFEPMTIDDIKALPIRRLAADDCAFFVWVTWPLMPVWAPVLAAWGVEYSGLAFDWVKLNPGGSLHTGTGYNTRQNSEPCLLGKIGSPMRLNADVEAVIMAPVGRCAEKPDEAYLRMERLYGGPYLELFARKPREGWTSWGDELPPLRESDAEPPILRRAAA
jgi:N6-adenosine-specific RNA methylase IME4